MSYIAPGTSPSKIWSYATRTLANHKRFLFIGQNSPKDLIGGFAKTEPTQSASVSATPTTIASYTETCIAGKVRVRVYAYVNTTLATPAGVALLIDGTQVATGSVNSTTAVLVIDYIGDITAGSHTFEVQITSGAGFTAYAYIVLINGVGIDSTTSSTVFTSTDVPSYVLEVNGSFKYEVGIRYKIVYNRKTTSTASITVNGEAVQNADLSANDDGDNTVTGYGTCAYNTTLTLAGAVGTSGDTIIITNLYIIVTLRQNQLVNGNNYSLVVEEEGVALAQASVFVFDSTSTQAMAHALAGDYIFGLWASAVNTASWTWAGIWRAVANNSLLGIRTSTGDDSQSQSAITYIVVVII